MKTIRVKDRMLALNYSKKLMRNIDILLSKNLSRYPLGVLGHARRISKKNPQQFSNNPKQSPTISHKNTHAKTKAN